MGYQNVNTMIHQLLSLFYKSKFLTLNINILLIYSALYSCILRYTALNYTGCGAGLIPGGKGFTGQYMGPVPIQHLEELG